jgi:capsular polysaccharide biosynthesis protein
MSGTKRWWFWVVLAGLLIGAAAGGAGSYVLSHRPYTSFAEILVTGQATDTDSAFASNQYVSRQMTTYAQIASSEQVARPAAKTLGGDAAALSQRITAEVEGDTTVLKISVSGATPEATQKEAKAVVGSFINVVTTLETSNGKPRVQLRSITDPVLPLARSLPPMIVLILGGAVAGLVLAVLGTWLFRWLYPRMTALRNQGREESGNADGYDNYGNHDDYRDYYYGEPIREPIRDLSPENTFKMSRPAVRRPGPPPPGYQQQPMRSAPSMPPVGPPPQQHQQPAPIKQPPPPPPQPPASPPTVKSRPVSPPANPPTEKVKPAAPPPVGPAVKPPVVGAKPFPPPPPNGKRPANGQGQPAENRAQAGGAPQRGGPPPGRGNPPPPGNGNNNPPPGRRP